MYIERSEYIHEKLCVYTIYIHMVYGQPRAGILQFFVGFGCITSIFSAANSSRFFDTPLESHPFLILGLGFPWIPFCFPESETEPGPGSSIKLLLKI